MPYITTPDGTDIHYHDWGTGTPVVLIHGWPLNSDMWEHQATILALNGYRVISYDRRGFGKSSKPFGANDYTTLANDLAALMEKLDLRHAALVGFSMGGGEVVRYLSKFGAARVSKAVLISASAPYLLKDDSNPDGVPMKQFDTFREQLTKDRFDFLNTFGAQFYGRTMVNHTVSEPVLNWTFAMAIQAEFKATYDQIGTFSATDLRAEMKTLTTPFLVIHGGGDATVPVKISGQVSAKILPNATYIEYDGEPHGLHMTVPDRLNADLLNFLGGTQAPTIKLEQV